MRMHVIEISVGAFILAGILALVLLAIKVSGLSNNHYNQSYNVHAFFDDIGSLSKRANVVIAGVSVGRVKSIELDKKTYMASVTISIDKRVNSIPVDSTISIMTAGLLGDKYLNITIGGSNQYLKDGDAFSETQSAIILENLIGKFLLSAGRKK